MDAEARAEGRGRVRALLVARLEAAGLRPARRQRPSAHAEMWKRLVEHLAYMDAENLVTLAEAVMDAATGPRHDECPSEVVIRGMAHSLQKPPITEHRILSSWLASVEGPIAEAGGYLVDLYRWLRTHGRPPLAWDMKEIRDRAEAHARQLVILRDRIERNAIAPADREWLERWMIDERTARRIVREGEGKRDVA